MGGVYILAALRKGPTRIPCQVERMNVPVAVARTYLHYAD